MSVPSALARAGAELLSLAALALVVIGIGLALFGCSSPLDAAVRSLNGSQVFLVSANEALTDLHRRERDAAVAQASTADAARADAAAVHQRYRKAWDGYAAARASWMVAAALAHAELAAEASGAPRDLAPLLLRLADLALSLQALGSSTPAALPAPGGSP